MFSALQMNMKPWSICLGRNNQIFHLSQTVTFQKSILSTHYAGKKVLDHGQSASKNKRASRFLEAVNADALRVPVDYFLRFCKQTPSG
jgi:hypothetical protein